MKQFLEGLLFGVARMREGRMYAKNRTHVLVRGARAECIRKSEHIGQVRVRVGRMCAKNRIQCAGKGRFGRMYVKNRTHWAGAGAFGVRRCWSG